jgi:serine protease Do
MNLNTLMLKAAVAVMIFSTVATAPAQPGGQIYTFYGEEPWGGSYLGVDTRDVTQDRLSALHLKEERGVEVTMVDQDAPAGKSGLKEHDVIMSINNQPVESVEQLRRMIHEIPAGRIITIGVSRDGQPLTVTAQLADRNKFAKMDEKNFNINIPAIHIPQINIPEMDLAGPMVVMHSPSRSGLMVENLSPQLGEFFGVKNGTGVLVRSVERGSRAEQAGFRAGDVVVKINGSVVNDSGDFLRLIKSRTDNKASITVIRDRKEQTLTLTLPEPRHSGEVIEEDESDSDSPEAAAELQRAAAELAAEARTMSTADLKRIQPELECAQKELQEKTEEMRDQMKDLQQDLQDQQKELELEYRRFTRDSAI